VRRGRQALGRQPRGLKWDGAKWAGNDIPDMRPDAKPEEGVMPFIMNQEGVARLFGVERMLAGSSGCWTARYPNTTSPMKRRWA